MYILIFSVIWILWPTLSILAEFNRMIDACANLSNTVLSAFFEYNSWGLKISVMNVGLNIVWVMSRSTETKWLKYYSIRNIYHCLAVYSSTIDILYWYEGTETTIIELKKLPEILSIDSFSYLLNIHLPLLPFSLSICWALSLWSNMYNISPPRLMKSKGSVFSDILKMFPQLFLMSTNTLSVPITEGAQCFE